MSDTSALSNQYLTFTISGERYAIPVTHIREVLTVPKINYIPRMPDCMRGVINLRGSVVPILDLKTKFDMGETQITPDTAIIVIELPRNTENDETASLFLGLFTDSVQKVISIPPDRIEPAPRLGVRIQSSFIAGMGHVDDTFIVILDIITMLCADEIDSVSCMENLVPEPAEAAADGS